MSSSEYSQATADFDLSATRKPRRWLSIVGINEDGISGLSIAAQQCLRAADFVFGGKRHLALADSLIQGQRQCWLSPLDDSIRHILGLTGQAVVVLASGDPFCHGIGTLLTHHIPLAEMAVYPVPSAFSLGCARLGWAQQTTQLISICGRPLSELEPLLVPGQRAMVLCAGAHSPAQVADYLVTAGYADAELVLLEALGGPRERIRHTTAQAFALPTDDIHPLNMVAVTCKASRPLPSLAPGREPECFAHDGQISRAEIRAVTLARLAPRAGDVLWDIGAGSGAVAIEWLLLSSTLRATAFEQRGDRVLNIRTNAHRHCVARRLDVIEGDAASQVTTCQPLPDAVFVGGGASKALLDTLVTCLKPGGRLVVNAVTLETEGLLLAFYQQLGGTLSRIGLEHAKPLGPGSGFQAGRSITQWCWQKKQTLGG